MVGTIPTLTQFDKKKKVRAFDLGAGSLRRGLGWLSDVNATGCQAQCLGLLPVFRALDRGEGFLAMTSVQRAPRAQAQTQTLYLERLQDGVRNQSKGHLVLCDS